MIRRAILVALVTGCTTIKPQPVPAAPVPPKIEEVSERPDIAAIKREIPPRTYCGEPSVIGMTMHDMTERDYVVYLTTSAHCIRHYPGSPCLRSLSKIGADNYRAVCGELKK